MRNLWKKLTSHWSWCGKHNCSGSPGPAASACSSALHGDRHRATFRAKIWAGKQTAGNLPCILKALCMYVCFIYMCICIKAAKLRSCPNPNLAVLGTLFPKRFSVRTSAEAGERCSVTSHSVCRDQPLQPILQPWQCRWTLRDIFAAKSAAASATDLISHRHNRAAWSS